MKLSLQFRLENFVGDRGGGEANQCFKNIIYQGQ